MIMSPTNIAYCQPKYIQLHLIVLAVTCWCRNLGSLPLFFFTVLLRRQRVGTRETLNGCSWEILSHHVAFPHSHSASSPSCYPHPTQPRPQHAPPHALPIACISHCCYEYLRKRNTEINPSCFTTPTQKTHGVVIRLTLTPNPSHNLLPSLLIGRIAVAAYKRCRNEHCRFLTPSGYSRSWAPAYFISNSAGFISIFNSPADFLDILLLVQLLWIVGHVFSKFKKAVWEAFEYSFTFPCCPYCLQ